MTRITLDAAVSTLFQNLIGAVELCDPTGRVLGHFVPFIDMSQWEPVSPDVTEEELDRRDLETESYSTAEVLARLHNMKCPESDGTSRLPARMNRIWLYLLVAPVIAMAVVLFGWLVIRFFVGLRD